MAKMPRKMILRPEISMGSGGWTALLRKYKFDTVMTETELAQLWRRMAAVIRPRIWYCLLGMGEKFPGTAGGTEKDSAFLKDRPEQIAVAVTLGFGIDELQENLLDNKLLLAGYAVDCLAMEALRQLYGVVEKMLLQQELYVRRYIFPAPEGAAPPKDGEQPGVKDLLELLETDIELTEDGLMRPRKTAVYLGILTENAGERCGGICNECGRGDCVYRWTASMAEPEELPLLTQPARYGIAMARTLDKKSDAKAGVMKYSYGYQKIFGKQ